MRTLRPEDEEWARLFDLGYLPAGSYEEPRCPSCDGWRIEDEAPVCEDAFHQWYDGPEYVNPSEGSD